MKYTWVLVYVYYDYFRYQSNLWTFSTPPTHLQILEVQQKYEHLKDVMLPIYRYGDETSKQAKSLLDDETKHLWVQRLPLTVN